MNHTGSGSYVTSHTVSSGALSAGGDTDEWLSHRKNEREKEKRCGVCLCGCGGLFVCMWVWGGCGGEQR